MHFFSRPFLGVMLSTVAFNAIHRNIKCYEKVSYPCIYDIYLYLWCMKEKNVIKVKFKSGVQRDSDGYSSYVYDYVNASIKHTKRFNTAVMILMGIDGCERNLMEWISDNMTDGNYISNNEVTRTAFIDFHNRYKKKGSKTYADKTVNIAFQRLTACGLLIKKARGLFMVNPLQYFKGGEEDRIKAIRMIMDFLPNEDTKISMEVNK